MEPKVGMLFTLPHHENVYFKITNFTVNNVFVTAYLIKNNRVYTMGNISRDVFKSLAKPYPKRRYKYIKFEGL